MIRFFLFLGLLAAGGCGPTDADRCQLRALGAGQLAVPVRAEIEPSHAIYGRPAGHFVCSLVPDTETTTSVAGDATADLLARQCELPRQRPPVAPARRAAPAAPAADQAETDVTAGATPCDGRTCRPGVTDSSGRVVLRRLWCYQTADGRWWVNAGRYAPPVPAGGVIVDDRGKIQR